MLGTTEQLQGEYLRYPGISPGLLTLLSNRYRQIPDAPSAPPKGRDSKGHDRDPRDFRDRDDDRDRPRGGRERDSAYGPRGPRDEPRGGYGPRDYRASSAFP